MANPQIKFYKVAGMPTSGLVTGAVYFDKNLGTINIATSATTYDEFGHGVRTVSYKNQVLTLVKANGEEVTLNFSDVASATALTELAARVTTNEGDIANLKAADTTLQGNIDTVSGNLAQEVTDRKEAVKEVADDLSALSAVVEANETDIETKVSNLTNTVGNNKTAIEQTVSDLTTTVGNNKTAADATQTELTNYKSSNDAAVAALGEAVANAKAAATTTLTEADPEAGVKVVKTTAADGHFNYEVTAVGLATAAALGTLDGEVDALAARVEANEEALEVLNGEGEGSVKKAAADAVASVVDGAPESFDTLKEIAAWIAAEDSADSAADLVARMTQAESDIDALEGKVDVTQVSTAISGAVQALDADVTSEDGTNVQVRIVEVDGKITEVHVATDNTVAAGTYATDKTALEASIAAAKKAGDDAQSDLNTFKNTVSNTYATKETVGGIDTRLIAAEGDIDDLEAFQTTASADIAQLKTDVVAAKKAGDDAQADVDALEEVVSGLQTNLGNNYATKAELATTNGNVTANTTAITTLNANSETVGSVDYKIKEALTWAEFE
jgi:archaellum component FlaC